eukprot:TRINITY_DN458_c0_g1_i3.p1 TRINITY_DN458_c0_g1~~TRINITY_DN458_c0_g1_i3.p1  ORF type:complete len:126 (+),score=5.41 TRINITY_DN458_c0_g1_i3:33-380(+)
MESFFMFSNTGVPIFERQWRSHIPKSALFTIWDSFKDSVIRNKSSQFQVSQNTVLYMKEADIIIFAVFSLEAQPLLYLEFLNRVVEVLKKFFNVTEESVKSNFQTVYQVVVVSPP